MRHDFAAVRTATAKETGDNSAGVDVAAVDSRPAFLEKSCMELLSDPAILPPERWEYMCLHRISCMVSRVALFTIARCPSTYGG